MYKLCFLVPAILLAASVWQVLEPMVKALVNLSL